MRANIIRSFVFLAVVAGIIYALAKSFVWWNRDPLEQYGITYEVRSGEHAEFQFLQLFWNRDKRQIEGPRIAGEDLYITFEATKDSSIPKILVRSRTKKSESVLLKLNFDNPNKPEFEFIGGSGLGVDYPAPWEAYYRRDKDTGQMLPLANTKSDGRQTP